MPPQREGDGDGDATLTVLACSWSASAGYKVSPAVAAPSERGAGWIRC